MQGPVDRSYREYRSRCGETDATAWRMLAALAVAEFLGMTLWFSATAVTPVLVDEFGMSADACGVAHHGRAGGIRRRHARRARSRISPTS